MNSEELRAEWDRVIDKILEDDSVEASQAKAFLTRLIPQAMSDGFIMLTIDNDFLKGRIESRYLEHIKAALGDLHGTEFTVEIAVDVNQAAPEEAPRSTGRGDDGQKQTLDHEPAASTNAAEPVGRDMKTRDDRIPETDEEEYEIEHESLDEDKDGQSPASSLTFSNFVLGSSNRMAYTMSVAVAEEPGRPMLNPLFIYGKSGLGKTHLMRAIQNYIAETRPEMKSIYTDSDDFTNAYVEAAMMHDTEKTSYKTFAKRYQEADILLIDDIQNLQGRAQTLDMIFRIFNRMIDEGKQIVLSADRAPKNITMDERYQSRFNSGGTFDIQPPEVETKFGIVRNLIDEYRETSMSPDFEFPDEISHYIAENSSSNIRELKSAVTKIIYAINAFGVEELTVEKVAQLLENHFSGGTMKKLSIADIQKQVELYYDVPHSDLIGQKRDRKIMYARKVAIYLARDLLDLPYNDIGKAFGSRDHTTVMHSVTSMKKTLNESREAREELENIKRRIRDR